MRGIWLGTPVRCAFGALALAVAGCTEVGPDFKTPDADVAKAWLAADQGAVRSDAAQDAAWWKVFADPVLDKLIDTAYQQNPSLHQAGVRVLQTQAQLGTEVGNLYTQQQQAFGSLTQEHVSKHYPNQSAEADRSYAVGQLGLTASWEIDFWGKFRRAIESADASLIASIDDYDSALVTLLSNVATTYVNIRTLQERLRIVRANIKIQEQSYQLALSRFRNGQTGERDVAQAKAELASTQAQLPQLQQALEQSRDALSVLLGLPPTELADLVPGAGGIPKAPASVAVGIPADLLRRRPDVRAAQEQAAAQSALIGATKAELYPAFSLTGTFGFVSSNTHVGNPLPGNGQDFNLGDIGEWTSRNGSFGPGFSGNLLNYGQITNQVRAQDAVFQQAVLAYQQQVLQAQSEVQDGLSQFVRSGEAVGYLQQAAAAAKRSADLALIQYREGQTDYTTVLTAQQQLLRQQDNLAVARGDVPLGLIDTYTALGGGWQIRNGKPLVPQPIKDVMAKRTDWGRLLGLDTGDLGTRRAATSPLPRPEL
jgi:NodT family efflux transporter outer membrane factor (OMF) lipoprotein